jgi:hypothetical protein
MPKKPLTSGDINKISDFVITRRPILNSTNALTILINDTEFTEAALNSFTIHDHFGLDNADVLKTQNRVFGGGGFQAWWLLQHDRGYKPFETIIHVQKILIWNNE